MGYLLADELVLVLAQAFEFRCWNLDDLDGDVFIEPKTAICDAVAAMLLSATTGDILKLFLGARCIGILPQAQLDLLRVLECTLLRFAAKELTLEPVELLL